MKGKQAFSVIARWRSCKYALQGVVQFVKNEHNARIHLVASIGVIVLAFALKISKVEAILLLIVTGLVWVAEIFNTTIERAMDFISVEKDPQIKMIKDMSAAAVVVMAVVAAMTGLIIFIPKF